MQLNLILNSVIFFMTSNYSIKCDCIILCCFSHTIAYIDHFPQQQLVSRYNTPDRIPSPTTSNDQTFGSSEQLGLKDTNNLTKSLPIPNNAKIYAPCLSSNDDNFYAPTSRSKNNNCIC